MTWINLCSYSGSAISASFYLSSVLFLTLSNLVFLLPIALAIYRGWYIESLIYFYNMFFSTVSFQGHNLIKFVSNQIIGFVVNNSFIMRVIRIFFPFAYSTTTACSWPTLWAHTRRLSSQCCPCRRSWGRGRCLASLSAFLPAWASTCTTASAPSRSSCSCALP